MDENPTITETVGASLSSWLDNTLDLSESERKLVHEGLANVPPKTGFALIKILEASHRAAKSKHQPPKLPEQEKHEFSWADELKAGFFDGDATLSEATAREESTEQKKARQIGPFTIIREIGSGGMGRVYLARQEMPEREVALKIIPALHQPLMQLDRFEREYQALALMQHPHIATVFDAGQTPEGDAWIAMEYVEGIPLTQYCRDMGLNMKERLMVFMQVLDGINHAHQKAMLHRDLKPSNILVTDKDGEPTAKIIDFGLAKALEDTGEDYLNQTATQAVIGTPAYMSPEQLVLNERQRPDTRTDIYALGVVMYQLLCDRHPFDMASLSGRPLDEVFRTLREKDPHPPSRYIDITRQKGIPRDLDNIALKAMAREVNRRYDSIVSFKEDLLNYFANLPVSATPPSFAYRTNRFVRRHKILVSAGTLVISSLVAGLFFANKGMMAAREAQKQAEEAQQRAEGSRKRAEDVIDFQLALIRTADPREMGYDVTVVRALQEAETKLAEEIDDIDSEINIRTTLGETWWGLSKYEEAEHHLMEAMKRIEEKGETAGEQAAKIYFQLGRVKRRNREFEAAHSFFDRAVSIYRREHGEDDLRTLRALAGKASAFSLAREHEKAVPLFKMTYEKLNVQLGPKHADTLISLSGLANSLKNSAPEEAERYFKACIPLQREVLGDLHPNTLASLYLYGSLLIGKDRFEESLPYLKEAAEGRREALGADKKMTRQALFALGQAYYYIEGREQEAADTFAMVCDLWLYTDQTPGMAEAFSFHYLIEHYLELGERDRAVKWLREIVKAMQSREAMRKRKRALAKIQKTLEEHNLKEIVPELVKRFEKLSR
ncbi:MAG: serine/threonine-protein kinase [Acidobacteriota bacterium]|nr:serine/threonine-protein kinase [Acidobacteriota bacterium]